MKNIVKVKCGAIIREIPKGALEWYLAAKWRVIEEEPKKVIKDDKTNTKKNVTEHSIV